MSIEYYWGLLGDRKRIDGFRSAISRIVGPGDSVLEVGAGLGTYSFFAADAGAERVWGVEGNPIVNVARAVSRLNNYTDRVEFVDGWIPEVTLPDRADVLIFEDFSTRLIDPVTSQLLQRVYDDYLVADARTIPCAATISAALVVRGPNRGPATESFGVDWSPCLDYLANTPLSTTIDPEWLAVEPAVIARFPMKPVPGPAELRGEGTWRSPGAAAIIGMAVWFDLELAPGEWISNAPGTDGSWGQLFLPLERPLAVADGEELRATVGPETSADGLPGWLRWEVRSTRGRSGGHEFKAFPASFSDLARWSDSATLELNAAGRAQARVLGLADGSQSLRAIAATVQGSLGVAGPEAAIRLVSSLLEGKINPVDTSSLGTGGHLDDRR